MDDLYCIKGVFLYSIKKVLVIIKIPVEKFVYDHSLHVWFDFFGARSTSTTPQK